MQLPFWPCCIARCISETLRFNATGPEVVTGIVDATFVYGVTEEEHDANIVNLMTRSKERGIKTKTNKMTPPKNRQIFLPHMHAHDTQGD